MLNLKFFGWRSAAPGEAGALLVQIEGMAPCVMREGEYCTVSLRKGIVQITAGSLNLAEIPVRVIGAPSEELLQDQVH